MQPIKVNLPTLPIGGRPPGLAVSHQPERLRISFRWRNFDYIAIGILAIACVVIAIVLAIDQPVSVPFSIVFVLVSVWLGWLSMAGWFNRTEFEVTHDRLTVRHTPVAWRRAVDLDADALVQVYVRGFDASPSWGAIARVWIALDDTRRIPLTWYLRSDRALWGRYIEREIEAFLGVVDRPIVCPKCGYDLRVTVRRCPECGWKLPGNKRERKEWLKSVNALARRGGRR